MSRAAAIYVRISDDREGGGLGVQRQEKDCRVLVERLGWDIHRVYVDNDLTAYAKGKKAKPRPGYDALVEDVKAGRVRAVTMWHTDRLHRTPRELEDFIDLAEAHDLSVETVKAGLVDLRTPSGRAVARTLCVWAFYESEHKSERIRGKYIQLAEAGLPGNGGFRPFGYTKDRMHLMDDEAEQLRWAYAQLLAGRSLRSIAVGLTERGFPTTQGRPWSLQALRYNLLAPRNAALREHRKVVVGPAAWPAIVVVQTWERARAVLLAPGRMQDTNSGARRYLLTGFLFCSRCGGKLVPRATDANGRRRYGCLPKSQGGCGGVTVHCDTSEALVRDLLLDRLERDADLTPDAPADRTEELLARIAADEERLRQLADAFADDPDGNPLELRAAGARIRRRIDGYASELAKVTTSAVVKEPLGVRAAWPSYDLQQRRHVLALLVERIEVGAGTPGRFDPDRLQVTWR
jgi:DNA invertase Pin-like site-specific DNA recombinase